MLAYSNVFEFSAAILEKGLFSVSPFLFIVLRGTTFVEIKLHFRDGFVWTVGLTVEISCVFVRDLCGR